MRQINCFISDAQKEALMTLSAERGESMSSLICEAIAGYHNMSRGDDEKPVEGITIILTVIDTRGGIQRTMKRYTANTHKIDFHGGSMAMVKKKLEEMVNSLVSQLRLKGF